MSSQKTNKQRVLDTAALAAIPLSEEQAEALSSDFEEIVTMMGQLSAIDTADVEETHQVTGLHNVWREDEVIEADMLTQQEALQNAKRTHNGYFVVPRLIEDKS